MKTNDEVVLSKSSEEIVMAFEKLNEKDHQAVERMAYTLVDHVQAENQDSDFNLISALEVLAKVGMWLNNKEMAI